MIYAIAKRDWWIVVKGYSHCFVDVQHSIIRFCWRKSAYFSHRKPFFAVSGSKEGLLKMIVNIFQTWNNICETSWTMKSFSLFVWVCRLILKSLQYCWFSLVGSIDLIWKESFLSEGENFFLETSHCNVKKWINFCLKDFCKHFQQVTFPKIFADKIHMSWDCTFNLSRGMKRKKLISHVYGKKD